MAGAARARLVHGLLFAAAIACPRVSSAQQHVSIGTDVVFYGDDTEFHGPFRDGETLFGVTGRVAALLALNDRVTIALGVYGNHHFGGDEFDDAIPVASLTIAGPRSTFVFGTLPVPPIADGGPDQDGPHELLPPFQRDDLAFDRPHEAGLLWSANQARYAHQAWLNWQRLNTEAHRERFDAGVNARGALSSNVALAGQVHVVHEGGQQFASGPVADSAAYAAGVIVEGRVGPFEAASFEGWGALSRFVPDRGAPDRSLTGRGLFLRAAAGRAGWRGHLIVWRGRNFIKDEGDPNYLSIRQDGSRYRGIRDYGEIGLARVYRPAPQLNLEVALRGHRIETHYDYSFRILSKINVKWR
jgi:hypothetical protein